MPLKGYFVLSLALISAASDLMSGRIRNSICAAGLAAGFILLPVLASLPPGEPGRWQRFFTSERSARFGALLPFLPGFLLFHFRMIGAGDVKLLTAIGAVAGADAMPAYLLMTIVFSPLLAVPFMLFVSGVRPRMKVFLRYLAAVLSSRRALPYRTFCAQAEGETRDTQASYEFHFAIPVFMTAILYAGGLL